MCVELRLNFYKQNPCVLKHFASCDKMWHWPQGLSHEKRKSLFLVLCWGCSKWCFAHSHLKLDQMLTYKIYWNDTQPNTHTACTHKAHCLFSSYILLVTVMYKLLCAYYCCEMLFFKNSSTTTQAVNVATYWGEVSHIIPAHTLENVAGKHVGCFSDNICKGSFFF